jgi:hypothetical protein
MYTINTAHAALRTHQPNRLLLLWPGASQSSLARSQPFPRASQNQSDSECRGEAKVYFARLNLLQIPGRNLRPLR